MRCCVDPARMGALAPNTFGLGAGYLDFPSATSCSRCFTAISPIDPCAKEDGAQMRAHGPAWWGRRTVLPRACSRSNLRVTMFRAPLRAAHRRGQGASGAREVTGRRAHRKGAPSCSPSSAACISAVFEKVTNAQLTLAGDVSVAGSRR